MTDGRSLYGPADNADARRHAAIRVCARRPSRSNQPASGGDISMPRTVNGTGHARPFAPF